MSRTAKRLGVPKGLDGLNSIDSAMLKLRSVWSEVEKSNEYDAKRLQQDIIKTLNQLQIRAEKQLRKPVPSSKTPRLLFDTDVSIEHVAPVRPAVDRTSRFTEPSLRVYAKDLARQSLKYLPRSSDYDSIELFRKFLSENLPFNSLATRRRNANYIIGRYFPSEVFHTDLPKFAKATEGTQALADSLFYLTCRAERIVSLVAEEVAFPSLAQGGVSRGRIRDYVASQLSRSKSANQMCTAIIATYQTFGIGTATKTRLNVAVREGSLASFAYVLHLEFPEPGMYSFDQICNGPMHKWLLWDQKWMVNHLYRLREVGLLSKVSEIDRLRQFTTKFTLNEAMDQIVALSKEPNP